MSDNKRKIMTENIPLLDDLIHYLKRLSVESVIKISNEADKYETLAMSTIAHRYLCAIDDSADFRLYTYRKEELLAVGLPANIVEKAYSDLSFVPDIYRPVLLKNKKKEIIDFYEEHNLYYKTLNGQPEKLEDEIYLESSMIPDMIHIESFDIPLHLYSDVECDLLYHYGIIDQLKDMYGYKYLDYLGSKRISIYTARKAANFSLLYHPTDIPLEILNRFKDKLLLNRNYIETVVHTEAYKFNSDHYENFLCVLLLILTITDVLAEMPDMINKNEIFDLKMVRLIFDNYGIDFFDDIPFHYQLAMIKNLHKLIKFKSTTLNIIDICSIFGFDNIKVFKYYILKERRVDEYGRYITEYDDEWTIDNEQTYELKFIKVPLEENISKYINNKAHHIPYDTITRADKLWDGGADHDYIKQQLLRREFNYYYSKYMSIDVLNSITELSFQLSYFYNILFDDHNVEDRLLINIPILNTNKQFKLLDVLCFLYALGYKYRGKKDKIISDNTQIMQIMGFNFEQDMNLLAENIANKGYDIKDLGIEDWTNPQEILTIPQLLQVYTNNKKVYQHLVYCMDHAENKREYDVYKMVFDALMVTTNTNKIFKLPDGSTAPTYTEFLKHRSPHLYKIIEEINEIENMSEKKVKISNYINDIVFYLSEQINSKELNNIFSIFPTVSRDAIQGYVKTVINFFKSYKIDIDMINSILKFDDKLHSKIRILDDLIIQKILRIKDNVDMMDKFGKIISIFDIKDNFEMDDSVIILTMLLKKLLLDENIEIFEKISDFKTIVTFEDKAQFDEQYFMNTIMDLYSMVDINDFVKYIATFVHVDSIDIDDKVAIVKIDIKKMTILEEDMIKELVKYRSNFIFSSDIDIHDDMTISYI